MKLKSALLSSLLAICTTGVTHAVDLRTFSLEWVSDTGGTASATGLITVDFDIFSTFNDGDTYFDIWAGDLGVVDFSVTISGANFGNGTFGLADIANFAWDSGTGPLDFSQQLIGQNGWGNPGFEDGDFNIFAGGSSAPEGVNYFTFATDGGGGDTLVLTSFTAAAIPEPSTYAAIFGVGALGLAIWRRRQATKKVAA